MRSSPPPKEPNGVDPAQNATRQRPKPEVVRLARVQLSVEREAGKSADRVMELDGDFVRVGSHSSNDLVLTDPLVSRFHCILERAGTGFHLVDAGSMNGTWISGVRIRDADIPPECRIDLGESTVRLQTAHTVSETPVPDVMNLGALYGRSIPMRRLFQLIRRVAKSSSDVLIEGENGTGKEVIATELVQRSSRAKKPLVIVDCGAISPALIESELFGHVRGSFTGASRDRAGAFEEAEGGTVFLDEIGELPLDMQPKLLRALASREIKRVGESRVRKVDIRVLAATNRRLEREVNSGRFREDLYYRLSVLTIRVPPLRERKEDISLLVDSFLTQLGAHDREELFPPEAIEEMMRYDWPGNVRELRNHIERRVVLGAEARLPSASESQSLAKVVEVTGADDINKPFKEAKESVITAFERRYLTSLLQWADGNVSKAARKAKLDRMYLHRLFQQYGLRRGAALD